MLSMVLKSPFHSLDIKCMKQPHWPHEPHCWWGRCQWGCWYLELLPSNCRTSAGGRFHRFFTSPHSDGGPYSLPGTVWSRSGCDCTEVSWSDAWGLGRLICRNQPGIWVLIALFTKKVVAYLPPGFSFRFMHQRDPEFNYEIVKGRCSLRKFYLSYTVTILGGFWTLNWKLLLFFLVTTWDYSETTDIGPNFFFEDCTFYYLNLTGDSIHNAIRLGDNLHFVAVIEELDEFQNWLILGQFRLK